MSLLRLLWFRPMRRTFAAELVRQAKLNDKIWLVTGDLGMGMWDEFRDTFPERYVNTGAAEQSLLDIACGLSLENKIPFCYSITTFLLYRPFETLRTYINHEKLNVKLVASGRDKDYHIDGISHWSEDAKKILDTLPNIRQSWPETKEQIPFTLEQMLKEEIPWFISLRR